MILNKGDMFEHYDPDSMSELWLVTTNGMMKEDKNVLVMGRGAAKQANQLVPGLDAHLGNLITILCTQRGEEYWLHGLMIDPLGRVNVGAFQTKTHWSHDSTIAMIAFSTGQLWQWSQTHRNITVNLNFPGIGLGGLQRSVVLPVIEWLPDNVRVWEYE